MIYDIIYHAISIIAFIAAYFGSRDRSVISTGRIDSNKEIDQPLWNDDDLV